MFGVDRSHYGRQISVVVVVANYYTCCSIFVKITGSLKGYTKYEPVTLESGVYWIIIPELISII